MWPVVPQSHDDVWPKLQSWATSGAMVLLQLGSVMVSTTCVSTRGHWNHAVMSQPCPSLAEITALTSLPHPHCLSLPFPPSHGHLTTQPPAGLCSRRAGPTPQGRTGPVFGKDGPISHYRHAPHPGSTLELTLWSGIYVS